MARPLRAKIAACKADEEKSKVKLIELGTDLLCGLKGDAFRLARDLGEVTTTPEGPDKILEVLEQDLFIRRK